MTVHSGTPTPPVAPRPAVSVFADLRIDNDGRRAHLVGDGQTLVLHTDSPMAFWSTINRAALPAGVGRVNGPRALGRAAGLLSETGITLDVTGPDGMIVRLGEGASSRLGQLTTGSAAVQFGSTRVLASTLSAQVPVRRYGLAAAVALVVGVVLAARRRRS